MNDTNLGEWFVIGAWFTCVTVYVFAAFVMLELRPEEIIALFGAMGIGFTIAAALKTA